MVPTEKIKTTAPQNTLLVEARTLTEHICLINSLVEEYEGIAVMRTIDKKAGRLKFWVPEGYLTLFLEVLEDFIRQGWVERYEVVEEWWEVGGK